MTTITIDRAVVEQALAALELVTDLTNHDDEIYGAIDALRAALVEPEQDRALQWGAAPARIEFGSSPNCWREAFLPLGKDNTLRLLAETEALPLVENALRAALAQQAEPTGKKSLQVESVVAENATTQQQIEQTPPSDYRRSYLDGYFDGFRIGKREGRIEAEDKLAQQAEPVEPVAGVVLNEEGRAALVEYGREEWHCVVRNARRLYTAPTPRKPLTEEEIQELSHQHKFDSRMEKFVRIIEQAHGIGADDAQV